MRRDAAIVEGDLVVTGDYYLVSKVQFFKVFEEELEVLLPTVVCEIACMDEDVPRKLSHLLQLLQVTVCIRKHYNIQFLSLLLLLHQGRVNVLLYYHFMFGRALLHAIKEY